MGEIGAVAATGLLLAPESAFNESTALLLADAASEFEGRDISVLIATTMEAIFLSLIFAASVLSNSLVFVIFYQRPALRSLSNRFVLNLALCDLLYSLLVIPYVLVSMVSEGGAWWCRFTKVVTVLLALGCAFSTVLIAVDRYCAVMNPLHYSMTITRGRCWCMIAAVWLLAAALASLPVAGFRCRRCDCWTTVSAMVASGFRLWYSSAVTSVGFLLPLALLCYSYACMYRAAKRSSVRVRRQSNPPPEVVVLHESSGECTPVNGALLGHAHFQAFRKNFYRRRSSNASLSVAFFREEGKAAQTGLLVVATFACCWMPYFAFLMLEAHPEWRPLPALGRILAQHLTFVGCALNPFVYVYRNRAVWKDARHVLHCRRQRHLQKAGANFQQQQHRRLNRSSNAEQILLLNKDMARWRRLSRSLLRVATEGPTTVTVAEASPPPPDKQRSFRLSIAREEGTEAPLERDWLKVEVVHGSSWSLPNQNVCTAYLLGDPQLRTNVCFSDNYLMMADSRPDHAGLNNNNNNEEEEHDINANNNNASSVDNHLAVPSNNNAANHIRCVSATSLIFRVAHPSHSYPGTTI